MFIPQPKEYKVFAREDIDEGSPVHLCNKYLSSVQSEVGRGGTNVFLLSYNNYFKRCRAWNVVSRSSPHHMWWYAYLKPSSVYVDFVWNTHCVHPRVVDSFMVLLSLYSTHRYIYVHYNLHVSCQVALLTVMIFFNCTYMRPLLATPRIVPTNEGRGV